MWAGVREIWPRSAVNARIGQEAGDHDGEPLSSAATHAMPAVELRQSLFADRYAIVEMLGQGGMGTVYRALDRELDETIALKVLRTDVSDGEGALERFRREVKLARRVTHRNVARTYDLGVHRDMRYLTMELIEGEPLSKRCGQGRTLPLSEALRVVAEIASGLAAAHTVGVVHRDLKPDNVLCESTGRVVVTDFGIARLSPDHAVGYSGPQTVGIIGTPAYMAPEQVEGQELDGRADIYALGIVLFELLTGKLPFVGETAYVLAAARLTTPPHDLRAFDSTIPHEIAELVRLSLARRRQDRLDAQAFLERVEVLRGVAPPCDRIARGPRSAAMMSSSTSTSTSIGSTLPTIAVLPFQGSDESTTALGRDLGVSITHALSRLAGVRVIASSVVQAALASHVRDSVIDVAALGRSFEAQLVVEGSVRVAAGKARVLMDVLDVAAGVQTWAGRIQASADDPFELEEMVVRDIEGHLRAELADRALGGPRDKEARVLYRKAREAYMSFSSTRTRDAVEMLEHALVRWPDDPWFMSALGAALTRQWVIGGASNHALIANAEELSLRALALEPNLGETYNTLGLLRLNHGELRASVHAFREAITRAPLLAEPNEYLGRLLCESNRTEEGLRRLELGTKLDPKQSASYFERARTLALLGDRIGAETALAIADEVVGSSAASAFRRARLALWWREDEVTLRLADDIEQRAHQGDVFHRAKLSPVLRVLARGEKLEQVLDPFVETIRGTASMRQRCFFYQLLAEFLLRAGERSRALDAIEAAGELPLIDLLWLDRAVLLDDVRAEPRFAQVRAITASRVAAIWS